MGVNGLTTFVYNEIPNGYEKNINILQEIEKFKIENRDERPIIIFDLMGSIHALGKNYIDYFYGGRHNVYLDIIDGFFQKLHEAGAHIILFKDGRMPVDLTKIDFKIERKNEDYQLYHDGLMAIDQSLTPIGVLKRQKRSMKSVASSVLRIGEKWGADIIISNGFDCDYGIAQYAVKYNALAIFTTDSDFLVYSGNFQYWHGLEINFDEMTINRFNRQNIRIFFNLTPLEMRIFSCLLGNDYFNNRWMTNFGSRSERFKKFAMFIRGFNIGHNEYELTDSILIQICRQVYRDASLFRSMKHAVEVYSAKSDITSLIPTDEFLKYCSSNIFMDAVLSKSIANSDALLIDLNTSNGKHFMSHFLIVCKRLAGILLRFSSSSDKTFLMFTKTQYARSYELKKIEPIIPPTIDGRYPELKEFIFDENMVYNLWKWNYIQWALSTTPFSASLWQEIPPEYVVIVLTLRYLVEKKMVTVFAADAILLSEYESRQQGFDPTEVSVPTELNGCAIRIAQMYNKATFLIWDCLYVCGRKDLIKNFRFDGFQFYEIFKKASIGQAERSKIEHMRFYVQDEAE